MKRWRVETRVTVVRQYIVDAGNEKEAEAKSCEATMDFEEDENEETMSIVEIAPADTQQRLAPLTRDYCERCNQSHASIDCAEPRHQQDGGRK